MTKILEYIRYTLLSTGRKWTHYRDRRFLQKKIWKSSKRNWSACDDHHQDSKKVFFVFFGPLITSVFRAGADEQQQYYRRTMCRWWKSSAGNSSPTFYQLAIGITRTWSLWSALLCYRPPSGITDRCPALLIMSRDCLWKCKLWCVVRGRLMDAGVIVWQVSSDRKSSG